MSLPELGLADITAPRPTIQSLGARYAEIAIQLEAKGLQAGLAAFDAARRDYETWQALVHLAFQQNTADLDAREAQDYADSLAPEATRLEVAMKRRLMAEPAAEAHAGAHALRLWTADLTTFDDRIAQDLVEEAQLSNRYTALIAAARIPFAGRICNLAELEPFGEDPDRDVREAACRAEWSYFESHAEAFDAIFDDLVRLRHEMARTLGYRTYTELGYRRLRRMDYGPAEVSLYRDEVVAKIGPLVSNLLARRRAAFGWDRLRFWDEALIDPAGNPRPAGNHDFLISAAQTMYDSLDRRLGRFYASLRQCGLMDLQTRSGKASGGFCTSFPNAGVPFIFANFNGTHGDLSVFTHEMGHAFQNSESRDLPLIDFLWPTADAAEITSMTLEFLTYPVIGSLVGPAEAKRFRRMHMVGALSFLPYGACVDHFQHEVYAHPEASPAERHAIWRSLEARYLPWTNYGQIAFLEKGGRWQAKQHIYRSPFYYIDYAIAQCCALQFWAQSQNDQADAIDRYVALCGRGGSAPFLDLVAAAGLESPFAPGALARAVAAASDFLA